MRNHDLPSGLPVWTLTWLAALLSLCLAGRSTAPAKPSLPSLPQRAQPPAELLQVEDEPVAQARPLAPPRLPYPLRAALRRQNARHAAADRVDRGQVGVDPSRYPYSAVPAEAAVPLPILTAWIAFEFDNGGIVLPKADDDPDHGPVRAHSEVG